MASPTGITRRYPRVCPTCAKPKGYPYQVNTTSDRGSIEVRLRCRDCQHEWTEIVESKD